MKLVQTMTLSKEEIGPELILREANILSSLSHDNIVKCFGYGKGTLTLNVNPKPQTVPYVVIEYFKGGSLFNVLSKVSLKDSLIKSIFRDLVTTVAYCHSMGIAHRDIKPENIMFGPNLEAKLIDFGLSCPISGELKNGLSYEAVGSYPYWPPELYSTTYPFGYIPAKADIYSLGMTLFVMKYRLYPSYIVPPGALMYCFQQEKFWTNLENFTGIKTDPQLTGLLSSMLMPNSLYRPTIQQVLNRI